MLWLRPEWEDGGSHRKMWRGRIFMQKEEKLVKQKKAMITRAGRMRARVVGRQLER